MLEALIREGRAMDLQGSTNYIFYYSKINLSLDVRDYRLE